MKGHQAKYLSKHQKLKFLVKKLGLEKISGRPDFREQPQILHLGRSGPANPNPTETFQTHLFLLKCTHQMNRRQQKHF